MDILKEDQNPMVGSEVVNERARELAHLLPDNIGYMSLIGQQYEVKAIMSVMPEHQ